MRLVLALVLIALGGAPATAAPGDDPVTLIAAIYKTYTDIAPGEPGTPGLASVYSKRLQALIDKDASETPEGMVGRIDWDVFIDGQDWRLTDLDIKQVSRDAETAEVRVKFKNFGEPRNLLFDLVREGGRGETLADRRDRGDAQAALGDVEDFERRAGRLSRRRSRRQRRRRLTFAS
jgi:hypothetical protein